MTTNDNNFVSQWGQDKWVVDLFKNKRNGYFLDIGAYDGKTISNTYYLEKELDWKGILIEPNPDEFNKLIKIRANPAEQVCITPIDSKVKLILNGWFSGVDAEYTDYIPNKSNQIEVNGLSFETLLNKYNSPNIIDYMSLDIEGGEYEVLKTFPFNKYKILSMTVEHNAHIGEKQKNKQRLIRELLNNNGYKYDHTHEADDYFIYGDLYGKF